MIWTGNRAKGLTGVESSDPISLNNEREANGLIAFQRHRFGRNNCPDLRRGELWR
jgi:hypothetical protein